MDTTTTDTTTPSTANVFWQKSKWIIKGCIIGFMALLLMIPMFYVRNIILEREDRQREATLEISSKWAGPQHLAGPVVGVPYLHTDTANGTKPEKHIAFFLPDVLTIESEITPTEKHRGIFKVMLYKSRIKINGSFQRLATEKLKMPAARYLWNEAFVKLNIADVRGLNEQLQLKWKDSLFELSPASSGNAKDGMTALLNAQSADDFTNASFSATLDLNGADQLMFTPVGKSTTVKLNADWPHPSFTGGILPQTDSAKKGAFPAVWKSMSHTRNFPQQWIDDAYDLQYRFTLPTAAAVKRNDLTSSTETVANTGSVSASVFGLNLFVPVNGYQKTMRTVKYALLCILLTFAAFFLIETVHKKSVHPFQYGLIGLALVLFYTLLLSFSEYTGFNTAYIIASLATIGLIGWFVRSLLGESKPATVLSLVLVLVYSYVFSILQLQDYALIFGSLGLFLMLAVVMYFSRKIQW